MKKLSILAAGVAVLSMCACTEANEFTPSTNGNTKKITEIKVASNAPALATRTVFNVEYDDEGEPSGNYGVVTWEQGDELHFYKSGTNTNIQIFECDKEDNVVKTGEPDSQYNWNSFTAKSTGLDVGESYYAYYFPKEAKTSTAYSQPNVMHSSMYSYGGTEDSPLKQFMKNYDLLMSCESRGSDQMSQKPTLALVKAQEKMDPIYMDHAFALVTVDLKLKGMGDYSDYSQIPYYVGAELSAKEGDDDCIYTSYQINSSGVLEFSNPGTVMCNNDDDYYYYLADNSNNSNVTVTPTPITNHLGESKGQKLRNNLSFYFLVRTNGEFNKLGINILTQARAKESPSNAMKYDKVIEITFGSSVNFIPGNCYHFGLDVNYGTENTSKPPFSFDNHWGKVKGLVTLGSWPSGMTPSEVECDNK